jgi:hypothetical protein
MTKEVKDETVTPKVYPIVTADYPVIERALQSYLIDCMRVEGYSERDPHPDVAAISNLLHRLGRIQS